MYEHRIQPPLPLAAFVQRMLRHGGYAAALVGLSIAIGMIGYHTIVGVSWMESFLNASMLLGGMGPVTPIPTKGGQLFAGLFALYSGLVFLVVAVLLLTPVFHRVLHRFHWEAERTRG